MNHAISDRRSQKNSAIGLVLCLGLPFLLRLLLSWAFYGSTDTQNYLNAMEALLRGRDNLFNYYPPSFFPEAIGALGGLATGLPMTAVFKMSHAIPDLILSWWFYTKLVERNGGCPRASFYVVTFLLQLAPSIVLVSHIHGQMDSWSILFTVMAVEFFLSEKPGWAFAGGLAMIFGAGIKIFPLFLIPCFYVYRPWRIRHLLWFTLGLATGFGAYFSQRLSDPHLVWVITTGALGYQSQALMGIKGIIWPYLEKLPGGAPSLRLFVIGALSMAYAFALLRRLDLYRSILLSLLAVMTVSFHMAPQYLLWPTFLLFFLGLYRTALFYNLGTGALLIFYYYYTRDNSGAYVPLLHLDALAPTRPHWFDNPYALYLFNDRLRGPGIWLVISLTLISLIVTTLIRRGIRSAPLAAEVADTRLLNSRRKRVLCVAVLGTAYGLTLAVTWPSPFRRALGRQIDSDYYRVNYFSYGKDYLYEVSIPAAASERPGQASLRFTFSGNDFYTIFQNGVPLPAPFVGRAYPGHHGGVFGYHRVTHDLPDAGAHGGTQTGEIKFWILDGLGSIDPYRMPRFNLMPALEGYRIHGARLTRAQVAQLFDLWRQHGVLPSNLAEILGVRYDLAPDVLPDDGDLPPENEAGYAWDGFTIIEGLWIYLGIWAFLGLLPLFSWNSRASNT